VGFRTRALRRLADQAFDPSRRPGLEATEHFMSWLRFGITAFAAAIYLLPTQFSRPIAGNWKAVVAVAFVYSLPHIFLAPGRPSRWTRLRILASTVVDFLIIAAAVYVTGGEASRFTWLFPLAIIGNVLRYGDMGGAVTVAASMIAYGGIIVWQGAAPSAAIPALLSQLGAFWILYFMAAYLSRYATRMERVARKGTQLMEAIGRIGVPVNLAGNVSLALEAVGQQISVLFDVDQVFIWLVQNGSITGAATTGGQRDAFLSLRETIDSSDLLAARVVRERRPMFVNKIAPQGDGVDAHLARAHGLRAVAGIPLFHGDAAVGAMILADSRNPQRFREEDLAPAMLLGNLAATALYHASMHDQLRQAYDRTLETLGEAVDVRDAYTGGHSRRIASYADAIARAMACSEEMLGHIHTGALLHDIGKIGIPDSILQKPGPLGQREQEIMRSHSLIGARLLRTAGFPEEVVQIVRHLHERYDGTGYPSGLRSESIPLGSRILAVADAYEAMTSDRVYRLARGRPAALAELHRFAGTQFDPAVVRIFSRLVEAIGLAVAPARQDGVAAMDAAPAPDSLSTTV
jgi:putative nucleotidyltransferase with HDIG domain